MHSLTRRHEKFEEKHGTEENRGSKRCEGIKCRDETEWVGGLEEDTKGEKQNLEGETNNENKMRQPHSGDILEENGFLLI